MANEHRLSEMTAPPAGLLSRLSRARHIQWYIAALGCCLSLAFTFVLYPAIAGPYHLGLDPDWHGPLGFGIWKYHAFAYYPGGELASARGPLYPTMIAGALALSDGWWPYSVQLAQGFIFGLLCLLVYHIASLLWSRRAAVVAAVLCAFHPFLIWYTSRIWIETLMMFVFTALIGTVVHFRHKPTVLRGFLVGAVLGCCILAKSVYTPFLLLTPLILLLWQRRPPWAGAIAILVTGSLIVTPWVIRNGHLTGVYSPAVGLAGFTLHQGNDFVEDFARAPFSISKLYDFSVARMAMEQAPLPAGLTELERQNRVDAVWGRYAMQKMLQSPAFLSKKIAFNSLLFWTLGDTPLKSCVISLLQLSLVALFVGSLVRHWRSDNHRDVKTIGLLIMLFYGAHLPTIALARYSVVLVPAMLIVAVGLIENPAAVRRESINPLSGT